MSSIKGLDELLKDFDSIKKINLSKALNRASLVIENQARENAPIETGELRRSITHEVEGNDAYVGTMLYYAPYVHIGTGIWSSEGTGRTDVPWVYKDEKGEWHSTVGQKPQPFLTDALHEKGRDAQEEFARELERQLKELEK